MCTEIYLGSEDYLVFFQELNKELDLNLDYDIYLIDGEYHVRVK